MNILVIAYNQISKYNRGHELFRQTMKCHANVIYFGPGYTPKNLSLIDYLKKLKIDFSYFDFVFTHGLKYTKQIKDIYDLPPSLLKVHYVVDYFLPKGEFKGRAIDQHEFLNSYKPDIVFSVYHNSIKPLKKNVDCEKIFVLPFSACSTIYKNTYASKVNNVMTSFSMRDDVYPNRRKVLKILDKNEIKFVGRKVKDEYVNAINTCKINLGVCDIYKSLNMRFTEILSCGGFFLTDKPNYIERLNLEDGIHYVAYSDFNDMIDKIKYYFHHNKERNIIAENGMRLVRKYHSCNNRIKEMLKIIKKTGIVK